MDTTHRWTLPLIAAGQAQKDMTHNEALAAIDLMIQPAVNAVGIDIPPPAPAAGACWIVGAAPTGAWAGQAQAIAGWTAGGWRFIAPRPGMTAWNIAAGVAVRFTDAGWSSGATVTEPAGGPIVDTQARAAVAAILVRLRLHGLIAA